MLDTDIALAKKVISNKVSGKFFKIYPMTTENLAGYIENLQGVENVLSVTGSGDQLLNLISIGVRKITLFDINPFTYYYTMLKVMCIKYYDIKVFKYFFIESPLADEAYFKQLIFRLKSSTKVEEKEVGTFWDELLEYCRIHKYDIRNLLKCNLRTIEKTIEINYYFKEFEKVKQLLQEEKISIEFIRKDFYDLFLNKTIITYDAILMSNISDYIKPKFGGLNPVRGYQEYIKKFMVHWLSPKGKLLFAYVYRWNSYKGWSDIDDNDLINRIFKYYNIYKVPATVDDFICDAVYWATKEQIEKW